MENSKTFTISGGPGPADVRITDPEGRDVTALFCGLRVKGHRSELMTVELEALVTPIDLKAELVPSVQIGSAVRDKVTHFVGTVAARAVYMGGAVRFLVSAEWGERTGGRVCEEWIDEARLELVEEQVG